MTGCVFLDRDGTINEAAPVGQYVLTREAFRFLPGVLDALAFLAKNSGRKIAIVTNQSSIGRGLATRAQVNDLHGWMVGQIERVGGRVDGVYLCPHAPQDNCACRKPQPWLLVDAARELGVDLGDSALVGDTEFDLRAGWAAGVPDAYLVTTGQCRHYPDSWRGQRYSTVATLREAVERIVENERR